MIGSKKTGAVLLAAVMATIAAQASLFTQDFSSSTAVGAYVSATPSQNQFTLLNGGTTSIDAGRLKIVKPAAAGGNVRRTVDMVGTPVGGMSFSYQMEITQSVAANTRLITGAFGSTLTNNWMAFGIDATGTANEWKVFGTTNTYSGAQTLTFVMNDSGSAFTYTAPDSSTESLAFGAYDVWVGATKVYNDRTAGVNTANDLSVFAMGLQAAPSATFYFDNFNVQAIPEPASLGMIGLVGSALLFARRWLSV